MPAIPLSETSDYHRKARSVLEQDRDGSPVEMVWPIRVSGRAALAAILESGLVVACPGGIPGNSASYRWTAFSEIQATGNAVLYRAPDKPPLRLEVDDPTDAQVLAEESLAARGQAPDAAQGGTAALSRVLIVTTNDIPGYDITAVHGDVFGAVVRARNMFSNMGASLRTAVGGEVSGYTRLVVDSRNQARERLAEAALARGGNAVLGMRYDSNEMADVMTEIVAYGTVVTVRPREGSSSHV